MIYNISWVIIFEKRRPKTFWRELLSKGLNLDKMTYFIRPFVQKSDIIYSLLSFPKSNGFKTLKSNFLGNVPIIYVETLVSGISSVLYCPIKNIRWIRNLNFFLNSWGSQIQKLRFYMILQLHTLGKL